MDSSAAGDRTVVVRAPTRIDLGGGWTDVPPYCDEQGGFVCNVAINRYATATARADETYPAGAAAAERSGANELVAAALRHANVPGVRVDLANDFPVAAGLGGSSSATAAVLGALSRWQGTDWDRAAIAEHGRRIEVDGMGIAGGRQDHYAAAFGGALALTFTSAVSVRRLNVAINRYATATARADETYRAGPAAAERFGANDLVAAALRQADVTGVRVDLASDFPVAAGLGGSSSATAAVLGALARWQGTDWDRAAIAEHGRRIEVEEMGIAGGRQDHYAAAFGGALALTFTSAVRVRRLNVTAVTTAEFERRGLLVYTGESRVSGSTINAVMGAYRDHDSGVRDALAAMKTLAFDMATVLESGDLDLLGALLAEHWLNQRSLDPAIPTARIDEIVMRAQTAGAVGWKAMGASGGGCVFVLSGADNVDAVRDSVAPLGAIVPFALDQGGLSEASVSPSC